MDAQTNGLPHLTVALLVIAELVLLVNYRVMLRLESHFMRDNGPR